MNLLVKFIHKTGLREFLFVSYLISGTVKGYLSTKSINLGIDFTLITIVLLAATIIIYAINSPKEYHTHVFSGLKKIGFLLAFYCWCWVTLTYSPSESHGIRKAVLFFTNVIAILTPLGIINFNLNKFIAYFLFYSGLFGIYSIISYGDYFGEASNFLNHSIEFYQSFYLDAGYALGLASLLALMLNKPNLKLVLFGLFYSLLLATAARGPIIFSTIALILLIILKLFNSPPLSWPSRIKGRVKEIGLVLASLTLGLFLINSFDAGKICFNRTLHRFSVVVPENAEEAYQKGVANASLESNETILPSTEHTLEAKSSLARIEHISFSIEMIRKSFAAFTFGYGLGSYGKLKDGEEKRLYPHNIFLEIWFELGIIGVILFALFLVISLYWIVQNNQHILIFGLLFLLANTLKSYSLVDHRVFMGFLGIGIFTFIDKKPLKVFNSVKNKLL